MQLAIFNKLSHVCSVLYVWRWLTTRHAVKWNRWKYLNVNRESALARSRKYNPTISTTRRLHRATTVAFYPLCKSMQNNAAVLPAQVRRGCNVYAYAYGQERTTATRWSQVKTHLSLHAQLDDYFASAATRGKKGRFHQAGCINVVCTTLTFYGRRTTYLHETWTRACDKAKKSISNALFACFYTQ